MSGKQRILCLSLQLQDSTGWQDSNFFHLAHLTDDRVGHPKSEQLVIDIMPERFKRQHRDQAGPIRG